MNSKLVILGSGGGPTPKPDRHAASHALVLDGETQVVDCGNGVGGQLVRAGIPLASLRRILITHHHIDHVADFGVLLHQSWLRLTRPVELIGPPPIAKMMQLYLEMFAQDIGWRVVDDGRRDLREFIQVREITEPGVIIDTSDLKISCTLVEHPPVDRVFAYRFDSTVGSVVFSADTVPSLNLQQLARGADVLVHEALYLDPSELRLPPARVERMMERMVRVHSQPEAAGRIAREAGVRLLVLSPLGTFGPVDEQLLRDRAASEFRGEIRVGRDLLDIPLPHTGAAAPTANP